MNDLIKSVGKQYCIPNLEIDSKVTEGILGDNFIISSKQKKFFLKLYNTKHTLEEIKKIHLVKNFFAKRDIPVILPLPGIDNRTICEFEQRLIAVFPFVEGKKIERNNLPVDAIKSLGTMMARIHLAGSKDFSVNLKIQDHSWSAQDANLYFGEIISAIKSRSKLHEFDKISLEHLQQKLAWVNSNSLVIKDFDLLLNHLTHNDLFEHNVFFDKNNQIKYVFDWEKAAVNDRRIPLIRSIIYMISKDTSNDVDFNSIDSFLTAYSAGYKLTASHLSRALDAFRVSWMHRGWIFHQHYLKNNTRADQFVPSQVKILKLFTTDFDQFKKRFVQSLN